MKNKNNTICKYNYLFNSPMNRNIFALVIIVLLTIASADYTCTSESYNQYRLDFGKTQDLTPEQYQAKFTKFCWSLQNVQNLNSQSTTATYSINQFADFLDEDNKKLLGAKRPQGQGLPSSSIPSVQASLQVGAAPPNWRSKASSIKDQGTCGACWAFTTTGLYETFMMVKGKPEEDLSEEFILECTNSLAPSNYVSDCTGGFTDFSLQVVKNYGMPKETQWPYKASTFGSVAGAPSSVGICDTNQTFVKYDKAMGAKNDMNVTRYDNVTVSKMQTLLADGPVGALMMVDAAFQAYKSGVYTGCPSFDNAYAAINHAVVIVGMDADKNYIIKNSWGKLWGDSGFATVSSVNDCALSAYAFQISWGYQLIGSSLIFLLGLLVFAF